MIQLSAKLQTFEAGSALAQPHLELRPEDMTHDMERFCGWVVLALLSAHALAVPTGNSTAIVTSTTTSTRSPLKTYGSTPGLQATFATEPPGRGTVGILISCTATFFFCIWTAMHPNIIPGVSSWYRLYHRLVLMAISIVIPEGILICAMGEFRDAKGVRDAWAADKHIPQQRKVHGGHAGGLFRGDGGLCGG